MSVKIHEAYCLDSQQHRLLWWDDFLGDQLQDEWAAFGTGSVNVIDQQTGGIIRIVTLGAAGAATGVYWNNIRTLHVDQRVSMEIRVKLSTTSNIDVELSLYFDGSNRIDFRYDDSTDTNWMIINEDGGASTPQDSGVTPDTSYHIFRIEVHTHGSNHVHFYIDGTETNNSPKADNVPDDATDYLQPWLRVETEEDVIKSIDVDYVVVRQEI